MPPFFSRAALQIRRAACLVVWLWLETPSGQPYTKPRRVSSRGVILLNAHSSLPMIGIVCRMLQVPLAAILAASFLAAQTAEKAPPVATPSVERAIDLTAKGPCVEALPILKKSISSLTDKQLEYR